MPSRALTYFSLVVLLFCTSIIGFGQVTADGDRESVLKTVQLLLDGWRESDASKLETALHPSFREVTLHLQEGKWNFAAVERDKLIQTMGRIPKGTWDDQLVDPQVHLDGPIAAVWSHYRFTVRYTENGVAQSPTHCGIETFQLYKTESGWKIINFADTHVDTCPTPTPKPPPVNNAELPVVSPDGAHVAFVSNRNGADDVFVISSDGTGELQLTHTPEEEGSIQWTRNGKEIIFSRFANDTSQIYAIGLTGKNEHEIGSVPGRSPIFSPDGKMLMYMAGTWTATKLMTSAPDGTNARQINDGKSIAWNNHWSPDGKQIAFTGRADPKSELAIFVMNADGSKMHQITHLAAAEGHAQLPVWSPDGRKLAIQVNDHTRVNGSAHIWIVDIATGDAHKLAPHDQPYLDEAPYWFPDGKRIAFQSNRTGPMEAWVMLSDGSEARQLTVSHAP